MNSIAEETFANIRTVKSFATEQSESARFKAKNLKVLALGKKKAIFYGIMTLYGELVGACIIGYLIHVAYELYTNNLLTLGDMLAYIDSVIIVLLYLGGLAELSGGMAYISGASEEIIKIIRHEPKI